MGIETYKFLKIFQKQTHAVYTTLQILLQCQWQSAMNKFVLREKSGVIILTLPSNLEAQNPSSVEAPLFLSTSVLTCSNWFSSFTLSIFIQIRTQLWALQDQTMMIFSPVREGEALLPHECQKQPWHPSNKREKPWKPWFSSSPIFNRKWCCKFCFRGWGDISPIDVRCYKYCRRVSQGGKAIC